MSKQFEGYLQPNIAPANSSRLFEAEMRPITVDAPASYADLHGALLSHGSAQAKALGELLIVANDKVEKIISPRIWLPRSAECRQLSEGTVELDEPGVTVVALERSTAVFQKRPIKSRTALLPHTLGFVLNTKESPTTKLVLATERRRRPQHIVLISGRVGR